MGRKALKGRECAVASAQGRRFAALRLAGWLSPLQVAGVSVLGNGAGAGVLVSGRSGAGPTGV